LLSGEKEFKERAIWNACSAYYGLSYTMVRILKEENRYLVIKNINREYNLKKRIKYIKKIANYRKIEYNEATVCCFLRIFFWCINGPGKWFLIDFKRV
jgi:hypothetical protein